MMPHPIVIALSIAAFFAGINAQAAISSSESNGGQEVQAAPVPAQSQDHDNRIIDGAIFPESIPTPRAYRLVFLALAEPENSTDAQRARAQAKIREAGLDEADEEALFHLLAQFQAELDTIANQRRSIRDQNRKPDPSSAFGKELARLAVQEETLVTKTIDALSVVLTKDGGDRFEAFVERAKRRMKVVPNDQMSKTGALTLADHLKPRFFEHQPPESLR